MYIPVITILASTLHPMLNRHGEVEIDYLSPSIEAIIRVLGPNGAPLLLTLIIKPGFLPGIQLGINEQCPDWNDWGLEALDHVERMRGEFTAREGEEGRVQVL